MTGLNALQRDSLNNEFRSGTEPGLTEKQQENHKKKAKQLV